MLWSDRFLMLRTANEEGGAMPEWGKASAVIGDVEIGVVVYSSTGDMVEIDEGGRRVVTGATECITGIGERSKGSEIIETGTISTNGDWICDISCLI
ncbi:hypothetical protein Tco_1044033 [Tanacetum coccineum]|uniref:Uncharacterized protein n=1 Tax=Tanacetum coccineum TaxID=301880 RepID=A0ABQ5GNS9_9ASTR